MVDKARRRRKALAKQLGVSPRTAANIIRSRQPPPPPEDLARLLAELHVSSTFRVLTGRNPAVARGFDLRVVQEQVRNLTNNPTWYAETGSVSMTITREQHGILVANGAANDTKIQVIRSFVPEDMPYSTFGFSERCSACPRWIWCGRGEDRQTACACGHGYRVAFDLAPVYHWTQRHGQVCTYCATEHTFTEPSEGRNPWRNENLWQPVCNACYAGNAMFDATIHYSEQSLVPLTTAGTDVSASCRLYGELIERRVKARFGPRLGRIIVGPDRLDDVHLSMMGADEADGQRELDVAMRVIDQILDQLMHSRAWIVQGPANQTV